MIHALLMSAALAVPVQIPVQGDVSDVGGGPHGTFNTRFRLWKLDEGGAPVSVWTDTGDVSFERGTFAVLLGSGALALDSALFAEDTWLSVQVGDGADSDRIPVGWAPRAAWAADAGAVGGQSLDQLDTRYAKLGSGGTLSVAGALTLGTAPSAPTHAATKAYVDSAVSPLATTSSLSAYLARAGGTMTGALTLSGAPTSALEAATKAYVDGAVSPLATTSSLSAYLARAGGTMTGNLGIGGAPNRPLDVDGTSLNVGFTSPAGATRMILGNRDSAAIPTILVADNGNFRVGRGTSYAAADGGTFTQSLQILSSGAATFAGTVTASQGVSFSDGTSLSTSPYGPAFCARVGTSTSTTTSFAVAPFDTVEFDVGGGNYTAANRTYTPTKAGIYRVSVHLGVNQIGGGAFTNYLYLRKNGGDIRQAHQLITYSAGYSDALMIHTLVQMNGTTDALQAVFRTNISNALNASAGLEGWFCAEWVRP
jgi:hypothetical protein